MRDSNTDFMVDLLSGLDDIEAGRPSNVDPSDARKHYDATRDLLESLNEAGLEYGNLSGENEKYMEENFDISARDVIDADAKLESVYGNYIPQAGEEGYDPVLHEHIQPVVPQHHVQAAPKAVEYKPGENWIITEEEVQGMKSATKYGIKSRHSGQVILDNIMMKESALALRNLLNEGHTLTNPKILGLISSGIQYTAVMTDIIKAGKQRASVLRESKYDDAKELDVIILNKKKRAVELKQKVIDFLRDEGFIGK